MKWFSREVSAIFCVLKSEITCQLNTYTPELFKIDYLPYDAGNLQQTSKFLNTTGQGDNKEQEMSSFFPSLSQTRLIGGTCWIGYGLTDSRRSLGSSFTIPLENNQPLSFLFKPKSLTSSRWGEDRPLKDNRLLICSRLPITRTSR